MNFQILPEIAALVAARSAGLEQSLSQLPAQVLHDYWCLSRSLFHNWSRELREFSRKLPQLPAADFAPAWDRIRELIEVSFLTEMLTRVWGTVLLNASSRQGQEQLGKLAQSVALAARETRCHSLQLLLSDDLAGRIDQAGLDRFRRRTERWTDLMLAPLVDRCGNSSLAFAERRVRAFAANHRQTRDHRPGEAAWKLLLAGFRLALPPQTYQHIDRAPVLALVQSVLACLPNESTEGNTLSDETPPASPAVKPPHVKLVSLRPADRKTESPRNIYQPPASE